MRFDDPYLGQVTVELTTLPDGRQMVHAKRPDGEDIASWSLGRVLSAPCTPESENLLCNVQAAILDQGITWARRP